MTPDSSSILGHASHLWESTLSHQTSSSKCFLYQQPCMGDHLWVSWSLHQSWCMSRTKTDLGCSDANRLNLGSIYLCIICNHQIPPRGYPPPSDQPPYLAHQILSYLPSCSSTTGNLVWSARSRYTCSTWLLSYSCSYETLTVPLTCLFSFLFQISPPQPSPPGEHLPWSISLIVH